MATTNGKALVDETLGGWLSLWSTLKAFVEGLDVDPQIEIFNSIHELVATIAQLEARVSVLERKEGNMSAPTSLEIEERA